MLFKTKGKVEHLMQEHIEKVAEAIGHFSEAINAYLEGNISACEKQTELINEEETSADKIKKDAEVALYEGAYLPIFREDFLHLMELVDDIIDEVERVVDFLVIENPEIPQKWKNGIKQIAGETSQAFCIFKESFLLMYEDTDKSFAHAHKVKAAEKKVDGMQDKLMREIFRSNLDLARKIHLRDLIMRIGFISDSSENAADKIRAMAVKRQI